MVNRRMTSQQLYQLYGYLPYLAVVFHLNFCQTNVPKISYPKLQYEVRVLLLPTREINAMSSPQCSYKEAGEVV